MCRSAAPGQCGRIGKISTMMRSVVALAVMPLLAMPIGAVRASAQQTPGVPARDTVIRFAVASRTWQWPYLSAHVGLSCHPNDAVAGTTTAPDTAGADRNSYCAGALIEMRNSTLTLRGAQGIVHLRVERAPRGTVRPPAGTDSTGIPRR